MTLAGEPEDRVVAWLKSIRVEVASVRLDTVILADYPDTETVVEWYDVEGLLHQQSLETDELASAKVVLGHSRRQR